MSSRTRIALTSLISSLSAGVSMSIRVSTVRRRCGGFAQVEGFTVDFFWPAKKLIIEADSYTYHSMPSAFETDRERDQQLTLAGYTVVRFTYNQVARQRPAVADRIRRLLS
jgi:very-short-patch-repair endonuclease